MRRFPSANETTVAVRLGRAREVPLNTPSTLVRRARLGEREAFLALVREHEDRVFRLAWLLLPDEALAAEAAVEAFVRAEAFLRRRAERGPFFALVARGLLRRVRDERSRKRVRGASTAPRPAGAAAEASAAALSTLRALDVDDAAALALRYVLAVPDAEAFAVLRRSRRELERRTARALGRFRALFAERQPSWPARQEPAGEPDAHRALAALASEAPTAPPGLVSRVERALEKGARPMVRLPRPPAIALATLGAMAAGFALAVGLLGASEAAREWLRVGPA
ncbi:MAG TPA: hypothetical protein VNN12_04035, partial [Dehalococcoidia bacterium]|nr:hypothetical protein [Dehalococcoidia bacterium]